MLWFQATDEAVQRGLEAAGLRTVRHATYLLHEPADVRLDMGQWCGHFGTLTPFHRQAFPSLKPLARSLLGVPATCRASAHRD